MSMSDEGADAVGPGADATAAGPQAGPPSGPPGGQPGGQPPGGGPILAAIAQRQRSPQVSAPGPGDMAHSMTLITQAVGLLKQAVPGLQDGPMLKDAMKAITALSRHTSQGQPTAGVQQTQLQDLLRNVMRNALLQRIMGQQGNQGPQQAGPSGTSPMGAASAAPPMPSTPLPGA